MLLLSGDVNLNPGPVTASPSSSNVETSCSLNLTLLNARSVASITPELDKPAVIQELIAHHSTDLFVVTETWLSVDTLPSILNSLTPPGYSIIHSPRLNSKGGGLALILRSKNLQFLRFLPLKLFVCNLQYHPSPVTYS